MAGTQEVFELVEKGRSRQIAAAVQAAVDAGVEPSVILNDGMIAAMDSVGKKFSAGEVFVPEMLVAAKAMKKGVDVLKPYLAEGEAGANGKVSIGTVQGDLHDIGKNLVAMMIKSAGYDVIDLGVDVKASQFVDEIKKQPDVKLVALSGLLTTTMPAMRETVKTLKNSDLGDFKVIVGGAPVTPDFASEINADGYAPDAGSAVTEAKELTA